MALGESLLTKLEHLRQKPEAERRRWLWVSTISLTILIVGLWLLNARLVAWSNNPAQPTLTVGQAPKTWTQQLSETALKIKLGWQTVLQKLTK